MTVRLTAEQQDVAKHGARRVEQIVEIDGGEIRTVDLERGEHRRDDQHQRRGDQKRTVKLERAPEKALARGGFGVPCSEPVVRDGGGETAEKHEHFGGIAQRIRVQREARQDAAADMVDDDHEQYEPAKEIEFYQPGRRFLHGYGAKHGQGNDVERAHR